MKILYITSYPPSTGSTFMHHLMINLSQRGHEVFLITSGDNVYNNTMKNKHNQFVFNEYVCEYGVNICYLKGKLFLGMSITPRMRGVINRIKDFDVVHLHDYRTFQNLYYLFLRDRRTPMVIGCYGSAPYEIGREKFKKIFDLFFGKRLMSVSNAVIALNYIEYNQLVKLGVPQEKIKIIPLGIDWTYIPKTRNADFKNRYSIGDKKIILFLGRINYIKGIDVLIKSFAKLVEFSNDYVLVIAGPDGGQLNTLKQLVEMYDLGGKVIFTGYLSGIMKYESIITCDVMVLPSRYEIFSNVVLEALAFGKPIVTTWNCGLAEFIVDNKVGVAIESDNVKSLLEGIVLALNDNEISKNALNNGNYLVQKYYGMESIVEQHEALYERLQL